VASPMVRLFSFADSTGLLSRVLFNEDLAAQASWPMFLFIYTGESRYILDPGSGPGWTVGRAAYVARYLSF
jgi:hypothetical protein